MHPMGVRPFGADRRATAGDKQHTGRDEYRGTCEAIHFVGLSTEITTASR
jgi:hypothetical protein